ncbi:MAG: ThiF family adenylyltransferase [Candidatus Bipolaricaulota bacterium]|nr:ThiF family adenylyltransferase [Candidatus Bipolaricaulota bacterium]MDW8126343.1 ThiF family adenylyltransferase [Candidatus Bipolaricaulota bacterium]
MLDRYARQVILPQIGVEGQKRLSEKRVLVAGCGALGTHTAEALLRAGIKNLILVDRDIVEIHNLHRVSLYTPQDVGRPKAEVAAEKLIAIDPEANIEFHVAHFAPKLAAELLPKVDMVVDGLDNLETRYLVNDACVKHEKPWVYTAVLSTYGMTMPIVPEKGPCFRCLFPNPPGPGTIPTCAEAGILGPVPMALAAIQAATALAVLLESPDLRPGELLYLDLWGKKTQTVHVERASNCPTCVAREFEFLQRAAPAVTLCGDAVQILPKEKISLDLVALARRLRDLGRAEIKNGLLFFESGGVSFTVFPDGRALIKGVADPNRAQALYEQFITR